jgi:hypothetical protein
LVSSRSWSGDTPKGDRMNCPQCNAELPFSAEELEDGEVIFCDECEESLEVVHLAGGGIVLDSFDLADDTDDEDDIEW